LGILKNTDGANAYGSDPFSYNFASHLAAETRKKHHPPRAGSADVRYWRATFDAPSSEALHRHAERFGPEFVKETAGLFGVDLRNVSARAKSPEKRTRRTTETFKAKVLNLHARGVISAAIADTLNVSDRRVKEILRAA
jgi:hypothetical protein